MKLSATDYLKKAKNFCMMPWVHLHLTPSGRAFPCCVADLSLGVGDFNSSSLAEIWNGESMRRIRNNMLQDLANPECKRCTLFEELGRGSFRKRANRLFGKHWELVEETRADGSAPKMQMHYLDIRFSNLCNFRCRTCGPEFSSSIAAEEAASRGEAPAPPVLKVSDPVRLWEELEPMLLQVEEVNFAGGEPLISPEHYQILDYWIKHSHTDVRIIYTTNFSINKFRGKKVFDYWRHFRQVEVRASLDASGPRAEYLRKGTDWAQMERNRAEMIAACPEVDFVLTPTISAYNVMQFPDFHLDWVERGLVRLDGLQLNLLSFPEPMSIQTLEPGLKEQIEHKYKEALARLKALAAIRNEPLIRVEEGYQAVMNFLKAGDLRHERQRFHAITTRVDGLRNESYGKVMPEILWAPGE